jgi:regulator of extracellular matrix RemA (YlzA/DUF370 family)
MLVNIGFGNVVSARRIVSVISPGSLPIRKMREEAKERGKLVDATEGRKTRSVIVTDSDHVVLSALGVETIVQRVMQPEGGLADSGTTRKEG